ncbi:hypothetical protein DFP73DRAFT_584340 [Morchella snyderi]|nr:hypothetical protein DFP73DRAFT_584340 [Morchella snyderi]
MYHTEVFIYSPSHRPSSLLTNSFLTFALHQSSIPSLALPTHTFVQSTIPIIKMQYTLLSTLLIAATAAAQTTYRVVAEPSSNLNTNFYQFSWVNQGTSSLYAGDAKFNQAAEQYIVNVSDDGYLSFLSWHTERYQLFYVNGQATGPVKVDMWQGIPQNATQKGFTIDDGYLGVAGDGSKWSLCPTETGGRTYQLWYVDGDAASTDCVSTKLKMQAYGLCTSA